MKTDVIKQKYITRKTHQHRYNKPKDYVYELSYKEQNLFEIVQQFELAGLEPSELTHLGKIRLKYGKYSKNSNTDKYEILLHIHKIFPDFYEIRFLTGGIYIR